MSANGVKHVKSSPNYPASNGAAERMGQTLKLALKADHKKEVPSDKAVQDNTTHYRCFTMQFNDESWTPHTSTYGFVVTLL